MYTVLTSEPTVAHPGISTEILAHGQRYLFEDVQENLKTA